MTKFKDAEHIVRLAGAFALVLALFVLVRRISSQRASGSMDITAATRSRS